MIADAAPANHAARLGRGSEPGTVADAHGKLDRRIEEAAMARAVTVSVTRVLMRPARAGPTTAVVLSMPTAIPMRGRYGSELVG
jgi:hypothetical protein